MGLRKTALRLWRSRIARTQVAAQSTLVSDTPDAGHEDGAPAANQLQLGSLKEPLAAVNLSTEVAQHVKPKSLRTLSKIEKLPTELVEHIASYLLRRHPAFQEDIKLVGFATCPGFDGLLEFRATSRALRAKTDFMFTRCFETHAVSFTDGGILGLLELTYQENVSSRIRSLIFTAPNPNFGDKRTFQEPKYLRMLNSAAQLPEVRFLFRYHPINTAIVTAALKRLRLTSVTLAPSLVESGYPGYCSLQRSTGTHPIAAIFNATILSKLKLQRLDMSMLRWGTYEGMQPAESCLSYMKVRSWAHLWSMTSLTLVLDNCGCK